MQRGEVGAKARLGGQVLEGKFKYLSFPFLEDRPWLISVTTS